MYGNAHACGPLPRRSAGTRCQGVPPGRSTRSSCQDVRPRRSAGAFNIAENGYQSLTHQPVGTILNGSDGSTGCQGRRPCSHPFGTRCRLSFNSTTDLRFCFSHPLRMPMWRTERAARGGTVRTSGQRRAPQFVQYPAYWLSTQHLIAKNCVFERLPAHPSPARLQATPSANPLASPPTSPPVPCRPIRWLALPALALPPSRRPLPGRAAPALSGRRACCRCGGRASAPCSRSARASR